MDKRQQASDWAVRPLTKAQFDYAVIDAHCLLLLLQAVISPGLVTVAQYEVDVSLLDSALKALDTAACTRFVEWHEQAQSAPSAAAMTDTDICVALESLGLSDSTTIAGMDSAMEVKGNLLVKTLVLQIMGGSAAYAAVVLDLNNRLSLAKCATALGVDPVKLCFVPEDDLVRVCGYRRGCIGPIGLLNNPAVLIDSALTDYDCILCGAGAPDLVFPITPQRAAEVTNGKFADISVQ